MTRPPKQNMMQRCLEELAVTGLLPAAFPICTCSPLVELTDGGGFAAGGVVGELAMVALPAHTVQEIPATQW